jgi:predicted DNA-binding transcriptional regulator AlpA
MRRSPASSPATGLIGVAPPADAQSPAPERAHPAVPINERLTWGLNDLAALTGLSRRTLERERSAGRLPRPDLHIGKRVLWRPETINEWLKRGGRP